MLGSANHLASREDHPVSSAAASCLVLLGLASRMLLQRRSDLLLASSTLCCFLFSLHLVCVFIDRLLWVAQDSSISRCWVASFSKPAGPFPWILHNELISNKVNRHCTVTVRLLVLPNLTQGIDFTLLFSANRFSLWTAGPGRTSNVVYEVSSGTSPGQNIYESYFVFYQDTVEME